MKRKLLTEADLSTRCIHCSYLIPPREIARISFEEVRCPKCGKDFVPEKKGPGPPRATS